jgi:hypothetical protein
LDNISIALDLGSYEHLAWKISWRVFSIRKQLNEGILSPGQMGLFLIIKTF